MYPRAVTKFMQRNCNLENRVTISSKPSLHVDKNKGQRVSKSQGIVLHEKIIKLLRDAINHV